jgi:Flp pilus assembly pilin Flp
LNYLQQLHPLKFTFIANMAWWNDFLRDESGQDLIEYVLGAALISLLAISAMKGLGASLSSAYNNISSSVTSNT